MFSSRAHSRRPRSRLAEAALNLYFFHTIFFRFLRPSRLPGPSLLPGLPAIKPPLPLLVFPPRVPMKSTPSLLVALIECHDPGVALTSVSCISHDLREAAIFYEYLHLETSPTSSLILEARTGWFRGAANITLGSLASPS